MESILIWPLQYVIFNGFQAQLELLMHSLDVTGCIRICEFTLSCVAIHSMIIIVHRLVEIDSNFPSNEKSHFNTVFPAEREKVFQTKIAK